MALSSAIADLPLEELNLPDYARDQLAWRDIRTVGELFATLPKGPHGIGSRTWRHIQHYLEVYLAKQPAVTQNTGHIEVRRGDIRPVVGTQLPLTDLFSYPVTFDDLPSARLVPEQPESVCQDESEIHPGGRTLPAEFLERPISELTLSIRAYNCLQRTGIRTIGHLLTILPQGYSAVRMAGPKTWSEIEDAVADYLCKHSTIFASAPDASIALDVKPTVVATVRRNSGDSQSIEALELPSNIATALRDRDVATIQRLATLPLFRLVQSSEITTLTREDWFGLISAMSTRDAPARTRPMSTDARPEPSLLSLNLPVRSLNCFVRAGILDLDTLAHCTLVELVNLRNFGAKSLEELFAKMRHALDCGDLISNNATLHTSQAEVQVHLAAEVPRDGLNPPTEFPEPKPDEAHAPEVLDLDERLNAWFADLNERQRAVIQWRYGLIDGQSFTLEEVGERFDLTRERVRQLQDRSFRRLQHPPRLRPVHSLIAQLHHTIVGAGGVMSEVELSGALTDFAEAGEFNPRSCVRLLLDIDGRFSKVKGMEAWCLIELRTLIPLVGIEAISILTRALAPIPSDELLSQFKETQLHQEHRDKLNDQFILACVRANEKIVQRNDGSFALESWERHWQDDIVLALRRLGQPVHYTAIADTINASLKNGQQVTARAVHIRLMQHPDIFVWVGRRGTYGLKEWGMERALSYMDALTQVLQHAGHPLTITEILAALVKLRPYYDETSIQLTLGTNGQFRAFPSNTFGLAEWQEEDFAGGHYRVQRLFETSEMASVRGTKREVLEAINGVDSFIASIRDNGEHAR